MSSDVLILGAGAAGLSAALELSRAGLRIEILEARDRLGGRMFTVHDPTLRHAVELGAEFVHGLAPEIWLPLQERSLGVAEVDGDLWCSTNGKLEPCGFFGEVEKILCDMDDSSPDESFLQFLRRRFPGTENEEAKQRAIKYVSGFNAADPGEVSVHWLVHGREAEEQIQGDRAFHIAGGYQALLEIFADQLSEQDVPVHLNTVVREVRWKPGTVEIQARSPQGEPVFAAPRVLITFPLGVLQAAQMKDGGLNFHPALPAEKLNALEKLAMGKVVRVSLCFRRRIWEDVIVAGKTLADMSFLFSEDDFFPTWWTQIPDPVPIVTGWAPARSAESLSGMPKGRIIDKALESLSGILRIEKARLQAELAEAYFHDWDADPFSLGAYSYVRAGGEGCQDTLGAPIDNALFFAGEATDTSGNNGTVHGAIASGRRAAQEILASR